MIRARQELGIRSVGGVSRAAGIAWKTVEALEAGASPTKDGWWTPAALRLAEWHGLDPRELWPGAVEDVALDYREDAADPRPDLDAAVRAALAQITERQARILCLRFGIFDSGPPPQPRSLASIARAEGCSVERVRQIEAVALRRLRHPALARPLREACGVPPPIRPPIRPPIPSAPRPAPAPALPTVPNGSAPNDGAALWRADPATRDAVFRLARRGDAEALAFVEAAIREMFRR